LQKLLSNQFGALVTDITMPGMSGIDFAAQATRLYPALHIVLMTGYSDQLEKGTATSFPVLAKPFQQSTLLNALSKKSRPRNVVAINRRR
ncbi:MAG: response regulator, partial [Oxalobacteraceae bacterium]